MVKNAGVANDGAVAGRTGSSTLFDGAQRAAEPTFRILFDRSGAGTPAHTACSLALRDNCQADANLSRRRPVLHTD